MHIGNYIGMVHKSQQDLANAFLAVAKHHAMEPDVKQACELLASWSAKLVVTLKPFVKKYGEEKNKEPDRLKKTLFKKPRTGSMGLLRDLQDLWLMTNEAEVCSTILQQAALGLRDKELEAVCVDINAYSKRQISWLLTRMKTLAPQTLIAAE
jgi:hypothetical protein